MGTDASNGHAGPCDATKTRLIADRAKEVSQPDSGGGGSFLAAVVLDTVDLVQRGNTHSGDGRVVINLVASAADAPVPELASLALFGSGALSLLALRRGHRR